MRDSEGFTLVELMVVVLIIGILVAIAIPVMTTAARMARTRTCHLNQRNIEGAVQQYTSTGGGRTYADLIGPVDETHTITLDHMTAVPRCPAADIAAGEYYSLDSSGTVEGCPSSTDDHGSY